MKRLILFIIGGWTYLCIEIIYRTLVGHTPTHWSMFIVGGMAFLFIGEINELFEWSMSFYKQVLIGTLGVLVLELISGIILNIWCKLNIWDYSTLPFNILGQICLPFAIIWIFLVAVAIIVDDCIRYFLFGEEKPRYNFSF